MIAVALVPALIGATGGASLADALAGGYQPAMIVIGGVCVAGARSITALFVSDDRARRRASRRAPSTAACPPRLSRPCWRNHDHRSRRRPAIEAAAAGQTVVVIGGSAGIGLETARPPAPRAPTSSSPPATPTASTEAARELGRRAPPPSTPPTRLRSSGSSTGCPAPVDHVLVTAGGPYYAPLAEIDFEQARRERRASTSGCRSRSPATPSARCGRAARCCSWAAPARAGPGSGSRSPRRSPPRCPPLTGTSRSSSRPIRVNLIAAGFVDTPLSATLLGDQLDARREELRDHPADPAASSGRRTSPRWPST